MPLRVDVRINDELIERLHISRLNSNGGTAVDSINDYGVIRGSKDLIHTDEPLFKTHDFKKDPDWIEWLEPNGQFQHRYGDGTLVCLMKALEKIAPELEAVIVDSRESDLEIENEKLRKRVLELEAALEAPPY